MMAPDAPAFWEGDQAHSWRQVLDAVRRVQTWLLHQGLLPVPQRAHSGHPAELRGRALAITPELNRPSLLLILACVDAGLPLVLLHPRWTQHERSAALEGLELLGSLDSPQTLAQCVDDALKLPADTAGVWRGSPPPLESALTGIFTSGSTGTPRLVVLDRRACMLAAQGCLTRLGIDPSDRWLLSLPLAHVGGLGIALRCWGAGASLVLPEAGEKSPGSPAGQVSLIRRAGVTRLSVVPTQLLRLLDAWEEGTALRPGLVGGASVSASLLGRAYALGIPLLPTWGMTEACSQITTLAPERLPALLAAAEKGERLRPDSGQPLPGWQVRTEEGQLLITGPALFVGYQTRHGLVPSRTPDGFFATGDLGELLPDGSVRVSGRRADRIVTGGENVSPLEVEGVIEAHGQVLAALVYGILDAEWGERVVAAVVWRGGEACLEGALGLKAWVRDRLAGFKQPRVWRCVASLEYLENGKLDRARSIRRIEEYASGIKGELNYHS